MNGLFKTTLALLLALGLYGALSVSEAQAQTQTSATIAGKNPVFAGACAHCPWGELGEVVRDAMNMEGYDVQVCYNCNRVDSPRFVAQAWKPRPTTEHERELGVNPNVPQSAVDFGATDAIRLRWAYDGAFDYKTDKPANNLRLIAKVEDPYYLLVAVKKDTGITDLKQIAEKHMKVRILTEGIAITQPIFDYYGLNKQAVESWGGNMSSSMALEKPDFDVVITFLGSLANNPESNVWYEVTQKHDLRFLETPAQVREKMRAEFGLIPTEIPYGYLRGVDRRIPTLGYSGQTVIARADVPEQFAYDIAKALDKHRDLLKWRIRPFVYDTRTVWKNYDVPLHPGAARYYREAGYMK